MSLTLICGQLYEVALHPHQGEQRVDDSKKQGDNQQRLYTLLSPNGGKQEPDAQQRDKNQQREDVLQPIEPHSGSMYELGKIYKNKNELKSAFDWFLSAAEGEQIESLYEVALMYYYGKGTTKNLAYAAYWMEKAKKYGVIKEANEIWNKLKLAQYRNPATNKAIEDKIAASKSRYIVAAEQPISIPYTDIVLAIKQTFEQMPYKDIVQSASYPGGQAGIDRFIAQYKRDMTDKKGYMDRNTPAKIAMIYTVDRDGKIRNVELNDNGALRSNYQIKRDQPFIDEATRLLLGMSQWSSASINGIPVATTYTQEFVF